MNQSGGPWDKPIPAIVCDMVHEPVGHLVNDGSSLVMESGSREGFPGLLRAVEHYYDTTKAKKNVGFAHDAKVRGVIGSSGGGNTSSMPPRDSGTHDPHTYIHGYLDT